MTEIQITPAERRLTLSALAVVLLLSALDQTIASPTAMPRIIEQLHGLSMYAWVATAYLLTSTVAVPIYGKLSDLYGRKSILAACVLALSYRFRVVRTQRRVRRPAADGERMPPAHRVSCDSGSRWRRAA